MTISTIENLRQSVAFRQSLFQSWDGLNEKQSKNPIFATSNAIINDMKAVLNSTTIKQLFRIQLSKKYGYTMYYLNGLETLLKTGLTFNHQLHTITLIQKNQYISVIIVNDKKETYTCNLSENGLKQLKKTAFNKVCYKVIWDILERYNERKTGK